MTTHVLGAGPLRQSLWGAHFYGFLAPKNVLAGAVLVLAIVGALRYGSWLAGSPLAHCAPGRRWPPLNQALAVVGIVLGISVFWSFRVHHTFWGDGSPLIRHIPAGQQFHPLEPLTILLHHHIYGLTQSLFQTGDRNVEEVARNTVALGSAVAGAVFVPTGWALSGALSRTLGPQWSEPAKPGPHALVPLIFLVLLGQGYVQLFFGYVENYTFYTLALGLYFLAAFLFLEGRVPLLLPAAALVLALGLHLSAAVMAPSLVTLAAMGLTERGRRVAVIRDLALGVALLLLMAVVLARLQPGYQLFGALAGVLGTIGNGTLGSSASYLISKVHISNFLNEQMLIGPLGLYLFVPAAVAALALPVRRERGVVFAIVAGAGYLVACWVAGDSNLGYARNWDLLAPGGFVLTTAGLYLVFQAQWRPPDLRRWLIVAVAVSLVHTVPWVAMNTSFDRSFERLKTLPLGHGLTESVVGSWYLTMGRNDEAAEWLQRSLEINPANNMAAYFLGEIAMEKRDYSGAIAAYSRALWARPDKELYRARLAEALIRGDQPSAAKTQLDTLVMRNARESDYWVGYGFVWSALGQPDSAWAALQRARGLAPFDSSLATLSQRLREARDNRLTMYEHWPGLMRR